MSRLELVLTNVFYITTAVMHLEMAASWDVYGRYDVSAYGVACIVVAVVNIYTVSSKNVRRRRKKRARPVIEPMSERSALIEDSPTGSTSNSSEDFSSSAGSLYGGSGGGSLVRETLCLINHLAMVGVLLAMCFLMNGAIQHAAGIQVNHTTNRVRFCLYVFAPFQSPTHRTKATFSAWRSIPTTALTKWSPYTTGTYISFFVRFI